MFVFWVVFWFLYGGFGSLRSVFGALSMLLKVTFNVVKPDPLAHYAIVIV